MIASLSSAPGRPLSGAASVGRCDGLITGEPGIGLATVTADCVPVVAAGDGVVAAVHAGWRGAAAGIVPALLARLRAEYGVAAERLRVALGPAVGPCHYRVGPEVVAALTAALGRDGRWRDGDRVDLRSFVAAQLSASGVAGERIRTVGGCTACDRRLASYRRDGDAAERQWTLVYLPAPVVPVGTARPLS